MKKILVIVGFAIFWKLISYFSNSDIGIYAGLATIFAVIVVQAEESK